MSKSWRNSPAKEREIIVKKAERGSHRRMDPYVRSKQKSWDDQE